MKVLITGFGPFGTVRNNPSAAMATALAAEFDFVTVDVLPTSYVRSVEQLQQAVDREHPQLLLMLGYARSVEGLRVETVARRNCSSAARDIDGQRAPTLAGVDQLAPTLSPDLVVDALGRRSRVYTSTNAGGFVCNYVLYFASSALPDIPSSFIHMSAAAGSSGFHANLADLEDLVSSLASSAATSAHR